MIARILSSQRAAAAPSPGDRSGWDFRPVYGSYVDLHGVARFRQRLA